MRNVIHAILVGLMFLLSSTTFAQDDGKSTVGKVVEAEFSELERQVINKYYRETSGDVTNVTQSQSSMQKNTAENSSNRFPPGLAKKDTLPPGLVKQLQRNGTLPPGLAKRNLPPDLESQLPPLSEGYERSIVEDTSIVLVEIATGRIIDVIVDAVIGQHHE